ncbi:MAG: hypothetical protein OEU50_04110 [Gammaproteobacteria bacterium]|nr:hypothetical protein [Gammaproteobacteria bacterium]
MRPRASDAAKRRLHGGDGEEFYLNPTANISDLLPDSDRRR